MQFVVGVGQSFATPGLVRNGKMDLYPWSGHHTTSAQAEGAIEGSASDYEVASAYATAFEFSRFDGKNVDDAPATDVQATSDVVEASSTERVPDPSTEAQRRRLSEAPCPPPAEGETRSSGPAPPTPPPAPRSRFPGSRSTGSSAPAPS